MKEQTPDDTHKANVQDQPCRRITINVIESNCTTIDKASTYADWKAGASGNIFAV